VSRLEIVAREREAGAFGIVQQLERALDGDLTTRLAGVVFEPEADVGGRVTALEGAAARARTHERPTRAPHERLGLAEQHVMVGVGVVGDGESGLHIGDRHLDVVDVVLEEAFGEQVPRLGRDVAPAFERDPVLETVPEGRHGDVRLEVVLVVDGHYGATVRSAEHRHVEAVKHADKGVRRSRTLGQSLE
jgi:hypothetical protein